MTSPIKQTTIGGASADHPGAALGQRDQILSQPIDVLLDREATNFAPFNCAARDGAGRFQSRERLAYQYDGRKLDVVALAEPAPERL
jgi:hypothetical protein